MAHKTYIKYDKLEDAAKKIKSVKKSLEQQKIKPPKQTTVDSIKTYSYNEAKEHCRSLNIYNYKIHPDIRNAEGDKDYYFKLEWGQKQQITKPSSEAIPRQKADFGDNIDSVVTSIGTFGYTLFNGNVYDSFKASSNGNVYLSDWSNKDAFGNTIRYNLPSIEGAIKGVDDSDLQLPLEKSKEKIEEINIAIRKGRKWCEGAIDAIKEYNKGVDKIIDGLDKEYGNIMKIYNAYNALEKSAENEFEGKKSHQKYSKTEIAKRYDKLVTSLTSAGYTKKEAKKYAKKYLNKILKDTKADKVVSAATVVAIHKQYKKNGTVSGTIGTNQKPSGNGGNGGSRTTSSSSVVSFKGSSSSKAQNKKSSKKKKNKIGSKTVAGAGVLSATAFAKVEKAMNEKFKLKGEVESSATTRINMINANLPKEISNIEIERDTKIENYKQEQNEKIIEIYDQAQSQINDIDESDVNATERINEIKSNAEQEVERVNQETEEQIAKINEEYQEKIEQVKTEAATSIDNINKEATEVNNNLMEGSTKETRSAATKFANTTPAEEVEVVGTEELNSAREQTVSSTAEVSQKKLEMENAISEKSAEINATPVADNNTQTVVGIEETPEPAPQPEVIETSGDSQPSYNSGGEVVIENEEPSVSPIPNEEQKIAETPLTPEISKKIEENNKTVTTTPKKVTPSKIEPTTTTPSNKKSGGSNVAIPIGLGITAAGAAAVAGVRYVKNKKMNEEIDDSYDDENNDLEEYESIPSGSYMSDDYLGPEGTTYTDTPDDNSYTDAEPLEEELGDDNFEADDVLEELDLN